MKYFTGEVIADHVHFPGRFLFWRGRRCRFCGQKASAHLSEHPDICRICRVSFATYEVPGVDGEPTPACERCARPFPYRSRSNYSPKVVYE